MTEEAGVATSPEVPTVSVCLTCGMIETLVEVARISGKLPAFPDHECEWTSLPLEQGLVMAAMLEAASKESRLPRCADCGVLSPSIWSFSENKSRCKPCAQSNWRELWKASVDELVTETSDDPIEELLRNGVSRQSTGVAEKAAITRPLAKGRPRVYHCLVGQKCERCGASPDIIYNHDFVWCCKPCIVKVVENWSVYVTTSDPYDATTGYPVRRNRQLLAKWRAAESLAVVKVDVE
jgi:hypothetical protein